MANYNMIRDYYYNAVIGGIRNLRGIFFELTFWIDLFAIGLAVFFIILKSKKKESAAFSLGKVRKTETVWIDTIPCDWEFKRFKFIANNLFKGNGITKDQVFLDGDTPCVRYGEIYSKYDGAFDKCFSLTRFDIQNAPRFFKQGDILFAGTGELIEEIGKNIIYLGNESCLAGGDIIVAQHKHNGVFLNYALNSSYVQAQKSYGKAKLKVVHISASEIGDLLVALPPKDEQAEITAFLDKKCAAIDGAKERHQQLIVKLEEYKKSLIYNAVTGKIEC